MTILARANSPSRKPPVYRPMVELLESRVVPYSLSGNSWVHPEMVTLSFAPDGTDLFITSGGVRQYSNLLSTLNSRFPTATWQYQYLRAAQVWAQQTNLNFVLVSDSGEPFDFGPYQQGNPSFGDIRAGGYAESATWLGKAYYPPPDMNTSLSGEEYFNTAKYWKIPGYAGSYDLFTVAAHEVGHSLGLGHSTLGSAVMYASYNWAKSALSGDDIAGIRAIYGGPRASDFYDAVMSNGSFATATIITPLLDPNGAALINNLDVTTTTDIDFYRVVAPPGTTGTMQVQMQSSGLSLLSPLLSVYNAGQVLLQSASGTGHYGHTLTITINNVVAGQTYYVKADGANATAFGTGSYALAVNFGPGETPTAASPDTQTPIGDPPSYGGAVPQRDDDHDHEGEDADAADSFSPGETPPAIANDPPAGIPTQVIRLIQGVQDPSPGVRSTPDEASPAAAGAANGQLALRTERATIDRVFASWGKEDLENGPRDRSETALRIADAATVEGPDAPEWALAIALADAWTPF